MNNSVLYQLFKDTKSKLSSFITLLLSWIIYDCPRIGTKWQKKVFNNLMIIHRTRENNAVTQVKNVNI